MYVGAVRCGCVVSVMGIQVLCMQVPEGVVVSVISVISYLGLGFTCQGASLEVAYQPSGPAPSDTHSLMRHDAVDIIFYVNRNIG